MYSLFLYNPGSRALTPFSAAPGREHSSRFLPAAAEVPGLELEMGKVMDEMGSASEQAKFENHGRFISPAAASTMRRFTLQAMQRTGENFLGCPVATGE